MKTLIQLAPTGKHVICDSVCQRWDDTISKFITTNDMMAEGARVTEKGIVVVWYVGEHRIDFLIEGEYGKDILDLLDNDTDKRKTAVAGWKKQYDDVLALVVAEKEVAENMETAT